MLFVPAKRGIELQSRSGKPLEPRFPEITRLAREYLPAGSVLDGELIIWERNRLSFALLQRRLAAGARTVVDWAMKHPAHLVLFDVLQAPPDVDVRARPLRERRALLEQLLDRAPPQLALSPQTTSIEQAREWLATWPAAGVEGLL
jgi:ATP-dependent DNA ligase